MVTYISVTEECRRLARNVVTADFSDAQVISYQVKEFSFIATMTNKDDWASTDREFGALQLIETNLVASDIIQHYGDVETIPIWREMKAMAYERLEHIIDNMDTETDAASIDVEVDRTEFKSWYLNPAKVPPNRLLGHADDTEGF